MRGGVDGDTRMMVASDPDKARGRMQPVAGTISGSSRELRAGSIPAHAIFNRTISIHFSKSEIV